MGVLRRPVRHLRALRRRPVPAAASSASARRTCPGKWHDEHGPYMWSLATDGTEVAEFAAEYAVKRLAGGNADFAGGDLKGKPRSHRHLRPGELLVPGVASRSPEARHREGRPASRATERASTCSTSARCRTRPPTSSPAEEPRASPRSSAAATRSSRCSSPASPNRESYYPEFIIVGTALTDADIVGQLWNQEFASHAFGVSSLDRRSCRPPRRSPTRPTSRCGRATSPPSPSTSSTTRCTCWRSASRWPGPNLTRRPSRRACSPTRRRPDPFGLWDFGPGDHTAANDVREIYWDPNAISTYNGKQGAYIGTNTASAVPAGPAPRPARSRKPHDRRRCCRSRDRWSELGPRRAGRCSAVGRRRSSSTCLVYQVVPGTTASSSDKAPHEPIVVGVIYGTVNALLAIGLILIYRTNRFINFAYGVDGQPRRRHSPSACTSSTAAVLPRAAARRGRRRRSSARGVEVLVIRRFRDSSRLILTVASIGLAQLLGGIELLVIAGARLRRRSPAASRSRSSFDARHRRARRSSATRSSSCWSCRSSSPAWPGSCSGPTPASPCGPRPRTPTGPCCSASRSAGSPRSSG